ncbi:Lrp/AsnC ligand binding domain-containing protein [Kordiimonas sp. SCSIO 12610]|uniref:Lrp/AsnC ligand binding domain-containing protein n=1 Tax=Kordiimonas sp. SCSIO 12610 TaxID=2829597 RepID=UPI00210B3C5F|nr:Lrp/AsnC ligand binding domain-containing protein [Kordiimonas sp. SCSIO 12610]UTW56320.1 Lrp/AsnC ligand binding domain-containing protein [Kordiimonas sp. SCSIO 12610]
MKEKEPKLDAIDRRILATLQNSGRISNVDLADIVGLSPTPCLERVKRLETAGYIEGYRARLNPEKLGVTILAFIEVSLIKTNPDAFDDFKNATRRVPEIQECHMVAGGFDYLLKVRVKNMSSYRRFLGETISTLPGVDRTHTYMVMEEVKRNEGLAF